MIPTRLLATPVTVKHYDEGPRNRQGNATRVLTGTDEYRGRLWQEATQETVLGRDSVVDIWRLVLPAGAVIDAGDEVSDAAHTFTVEGTPARPLDGRGREHHVAARLRYVGAVT
jgi:hypothetical protein